MLSFSPTIQQIIVGVVTLLLVALLLREKVKASTAFSAAVLVFLLTGIIDTDDVLKALSNQSILSIFLLIFITFSLKNHFNLLRILGKLFDKAKTGRTFMLKMTSGVSAISSFLNNTPIVALFLPYVYKWSEKNKVSPSKLLIPLSFAAMTGGMITIVGTSTNLVLAGLAEAEGATPPGFLDFFLPGIGVTLVGLFVLYFVVFPLLPDRPELLDSFNEKRREYLFEAHIADHSPLIGKSIVDAGLRNLKGGYLFEIIRKNENKAPVSRDEIIQKGDILVFAGNTSDIMELFEQEEDFKIPFSPQKETGLRDLSIIETVIPYNSELIGRTLKVLRFREHYDAAVIAIHRQGEKVNGKIGEVALQAGDLLLIAPGRRFKEKMETHKSLYSVSVVKEVNSTRPGAKTGFILVLAALLAGIALGKLDLFFALLLLLAYLLLTKLLNIKEIKQQLDAGLLVILVSSLTFSTALINSGMAQLIADHFMNLFVSLGSNGILIGIYLLTLLLTTFVTHIAAVSIVFPIGYAIGIQTPGIDMTALFLVMAFAASASFHSPFSYQTNTMILGPGGYNLKDFLKVGLPYTLIYSVSALTFIILLH